MKLLRIACFVAVSIAFLRNVSGQGFVNLDFEAANLSAYGAGPAAVPATNAIPGWTAYLGGIPQTDILLNSEALADPAVSIQGTNGSFYPPMQRNYFILLQGSFQEISPRTAAIGQTGLIPATVQSMSFWADTSLNGMSNNLQVTFNGSTIPYFAIGTGTGYSIYGANISGFAGQTGQLLFTAGYDTYAALDNIQFSSLAIPEPSALSLFIICIFPLCWRKMLLHMR